MGFLLLVLCIFQAIGVIQSIVTNTYAGRIDSSRGNGRPAIQAEVAQPKGVHIDPNGDIYIAEENNIRRITRADGIISNYAGGGSAGATGDGISFLDAHLTSVNGISGDNEGNIYFTEYSTCRVRVLSAADGQVRTIAGQLGVCGYGGDDGPAVDAQLKGPVSLFYHVQSDRLFIAEVLNNRIRVLDMSEPSIPFRIITTFAGGGTDMGSAIGDSGDALSAVLVQPAGIWVNPQGLAFISELGGCRVRRVNAVGIIITIAGTGICEFSTYPIGTLANAQPINNAVGICGDSAGNVYFSQSSNGTRAVISRLSGSALSLVAGKVNSTIMAHGVEASTIRIIYPMSCAVDSASNALIVSDFATNMLWNITLTPVKPVAYSVVGYVNNVVLPATSAMLGMVYGVWMATTNDLYLSDFDQHRVHRIASATQTIQIFTGTFEAGRGANTLATASALNHPFGIAGDSAGVIYIAEYDNNRIRMVNNSRITAFAGSDNGCPDSMVAAAATSVSLCHPMALVYDAVTNKLYVSEPYLIRQIDLSSSTKLSSVLLGSLTRGASVFGAVGMALGISNVYQMFVDRNLNSHYMYFADTNNMAIRQAGLVGTDYNTFISSSNTLLYSNLKMSSPYGICGDHVNNRIYAFTNTTPIGVTASLNGLANPAWYAGSGVVGTSGEYVDVNNPMLASGACAVNSQGFVFHVEYSPAMQRSRIRRISSLYPTGQPSSQPSRQPSRQPSSQPTRQPSAQPSAQPSRQPSRQPTRQPTAQPSAQPVRSPSSRPTRQPSGQPTKQPFVCPSGQPSGRPTAQPSMQPTETIYSGALTNTYAGHLPYARNATQPAVTASINQPQGMHVDSNGLIYFAEYYGIRRINGSTMSLFVGDDGSRNNYRAENVDRLNATVINVQGLTGDPKGNLFYSEFYYCRVRMVSAATNRVTTVVGVLNSCSGGVGPTLRNPSGIAYHPDNLLYIAEGVSYVRVFNLTSKAFLPELRIGNPSGSYTSSIPSQLKLDNPTKLFINNLGQVFIVVTYNKCRILMVDGGVVSTIAGNGNCSHKFPNTLDNASNTTAIPNPRSICGDSAGNVYFFAFDQSYWASGIIYRLSDGNLTAVAGNQTSNLLASGVPASEVMIRMASDCKVHPITGALLISDVNSNAIWSVPDPFSPAPTILSVVGFVGNMVLPASDVILSSVRGIWSHPLTNDLFLSEQYKYRVLKVDGSNQMASVFAGTSAYGLSPDGLTAARSSLQSPMGLAGDELSLFIADMTRNRIAKVDQLTSNLTTLIAGDDCDGAQDMYYYYNSGGSHWGTAPGFCSPLALAFDSSAAMLYVSSLHYTVFRFDMATMELEAIAGTGIFGPGGAGPALSIDMPAVYDMWADGQGAVFMLTMRTDTIYKWSPHGGVYTLSKFVDPSAADIYGNPLAGRLSGMCGDVTTNEAYFFNNNKQIGYKVDTVDQQFVPFIGNKLSASGEFVDSLHTPINGQVYGCNVGVNGHLFYAVTEPYYGTTSVRRVSSDIYPTSQPSSQPTAFLATSRYYLQTVAGMQANRGDGSPAQGATLNAPKGIHIDSDNNIFITENIFIRKIAQSGIISTIAGAGNSLADNIPAAQATIGYAHGLTGDALGNLYYADTGYCIVRRIDANGKIVTVAGIPNNCTAGSMPRGFAASGTASALSSPTGLAYDQSNELLYIVVDNCMVLMLDGIGMLQVAARGGNCDGIPYHIGIDMLSALVIVADYANRMIVLVDSFTASNATLLGAESVDQVMAVCVGGSSGMQYFLEQGPATINILSLSSNGDLNRFNLTGYVPAHGIPLSMFASTFSDLSSCAVDNHGDLIITDTASSDIWKITTPIHANSTVTIVVGYVAGVTYNAANTNFGSITSIWANSAGDMFVVDNRNYYISMITDSTVQVFAGVGVMSQHVVNVDNVAATLATLFSPRMVVGDNQDTVYILEYNGQRIRKISSSGMLTTVAGTGDCVENLDYAGPALGIPLCYPMSMALSGSVMYIATSDVVIHKLDLVTNIIHRAVGSGIEGGQTINLAVLPPLAINLSSTLWAMHVDAQGILYFMDYMQGSVIRAVNFNSNQVSIFAGTPTGSGVSFENVPATSAALSFNAFCGDSDGNLFIPSGRFVRTISSAASGSLIQTISGNGSSAVGGENVVALKSSIPRASGACFVDNNGVIYYAEQLTPGRSSNMRIRKAALIEAPTSQPSSQPVVSPTARPTGQPSSSPTYINAATSNVVFTYAGVTVNNFQSVSKGDGGPAQAATLTTPYAIHVDSSNNYFVIEQHAIRRIDSVTGIITTVTGGTNSSALANGLAATATYIVSGNGLTGDTTGRLFYSDKGKCQVRMIAGGVVTTVAGVSACSTGADNIAATSSPLNSPSGIVFHAPSNNLFIMDGGSCRLRAVNMATGIISRVAGSTCMSGNSNVLGEGGPATAAVLSSSTVSGVWLNTLGDIFIVDSIAQKVLKVTNSTRILSSIAGNGTTTSVNNVPAVSSGMANPRMACGDIAGNMYIVSSNDASAVRMIDTAGIVRTLQGKTGKGSGLRIGAIKPGLSYHCALDQQGNFLFTSTNGMLWKLSAPISNNSIITSVVGYVPGVTLAAASYSFKNGALGMWMDQRDNLFITDANSVIHRVANGMVSIFAGIPGSQGYTGDGIAASQAILNYPVSVVGDTMSSLFIAEYSGGRVRQVNGTTGLISTVVGNASTSCSLSANYFGPATSVALCALATLAIDKTGDNLFFFDRSGNVIRKLVLSTGMLSTVVGNGISGYTAGVSPLNTRLSSGVVSMWLDSTNNMFIADSSSSRIRYVDFSNHMVSTVFGVATPQLGSNEEHVPAISASLFSLRYACPGVNGDIIVMQTNQTKLRTISANGIILTSIGNGSTSFGAEMVDALSVPLGSDLISCAVSSNGDVYFMEYVSSPVSAYRVRKSIRYVAPTSQPSTQPTSYPSFFDEEKAVDTVIGLPVNMRANRGDGQPPQVAVLQAPKGVFIDAVGNYFIAEEHYIRLEALNGPFSTIAGGGLSSADGIPATTALINHAHGIAGDTAGNIYYSDLCKVRVIFATNQTVRTVIGGALCGYQGDGVPGLATLFRNITGIFFSPVNNTLYVADPLNYRVRAWNRATGMVTNLVGNGLDGYSSSTSLNNALHYPVDMWVDSLGVFFFLDECRIRKVSNGQLRTVAGTGECSSSGNNGPATVATIKSPSSICGDSMGNLYFAEVNKTRGMIRKMSSSGIITALSGDVGAIRYSGLPFSSVAIGVSYGCKVGPAGNFVITDLTNAVWKVTALPSIPITNATVIKSIGGFMGGMSMPAKSIQFGTPSGMIGYPNGDILFGDRKNHTVFKLTASTQLVSVFAGIVSTVGVTGTNGLAADRASLNLPFGMAKDSMGNVYIAEYNACRVRKVNATTGIMTTVAGNGVAKCILAEANYSGLATSTSICNVRDVTIDSTGNLYLTDFTPTIRKMSLTTGYMSTIAGGPSASQVIHTVMSMWINAAGNLFFVDFTAQQLMMIDTHNNNVLSRYAGNANGTAMSENARASDVQFAVSDLVGVCGDNQGSIYLTAQQSHQVFQIQTSNQRIRAVIGNGTKAEAGEYVSALTNPVAFPMFCFVATDGSLYFGESMLDGTGRIRRSSTFVYPTGQPSSRPSKQPVGQPTSQPSKQPNVYPTSRPSSQPRGQPTSQPSRRPSSQPSRQPSMQPTSQPSAQPTGQPSLQPVLRPTVQPSRQPTRQPSLKPFGRPTGRPSSQPSHRPTAQPVGKPTGQPSLRPSDQPTLQPIAQPSQRPSAQPSTGPSGRPSSRPSAQPIGSPSAQPLGRPTSKPTSQPSAQPSDQPSGFPSSQPTGCPTILHSSAPSAQPSVKPSVQPTRIPSSGPSVHPSGQPSCEPSSQPTINPSAQPVSFPSTQPSGVPSCQPSGKPLASPSSKPSSQPSDKPSSHPTAQPSNQPSTGPSGKPSSQPTSSPTARPTSGPTTQPTDRPSVQPSDKPSALPSIKPSAQPSGDPTGLPTGYPSCQPSGRPSAQPSSDPTVHPTGRPSAQPSAIPSTEPTVRPSSVPSTQPTLKPTGLPSAMPSSQPSLRPSSAPSAVPTDSPTLQPSAQPTCVPSSQPTAFPSSRPSRSPTGCPSASPSGLPSRRPTMQPSAAPSAQPLSKPSAQPSSKPTWQPTSSPTSSPSVQSMSRPSGQPLSRPSSQPSSSPSVCPSSEPSSRPTFQPQSSPTGQPSASPAASPTAQPSVSPTSQPTSRPTAQPSRQPIAHPTSAPTAVPIGQPTSQPSSSPTADPSFLTFALQQQSAQITEGVDYLNFISVTMTTNAHVQGMLGFQLTELVDGTVVRSLSSSLVPSFYDISNAAANGSTAVTTRLSASLSQLTVGTYKLVMSLSGSTIPKHIALVYGSSSAAYSLITVVANTIPLAAPNLQSALYAADGSYLQISFNGDTNRGGTQAKFVCSSLFSFTCAGTFSCTWTDDATVKAYISSSASTLATCALPRTSLTLSSNAAVKAKCKASCSTAASWPNAISAGVAIAVPTAKQLPSVVINSNDVIGSCATLLLDLSASTGDGGRGWNSSVLVSSRDTTGAIGDTTDLQYFLSSRNFTLFPPARIPAAYFTSGYTYEFRVMLCNFMDSCASMTKKVSVVATLLPSVTIPGSTTRTMKRKDSLTVIAQGAMPSCTGKPSSLSSFTYSWTIVKNNQTNLAFSSTSKDQARLVLAGYALQTGNNHAITVSMSGPSTPTVRASTNVQVIAGDIIASIAGGAATNMRIGETLQLNASTSSDEDNPNSANLQFSWSCMQTAPVINSSCRGIFAESAFAASKSLPVVELSALNLAANVNAAVRVTVTVRDPSSPGRAAATAVKEISLLAPLAPAIVELITSAGAAAQSINAFQSLYLMGKVDIPPPLSVGFVQWTLDEGAGTSLPLVALANTNASVLIPNTTALTSRSFAFYLPLIALKLPAGVSLTFRLSCFMRQGAATLSTTAAVTLKINAPPRPGLFQVTPDHGVQLSQVFAFALTNWQDDDLPLTYQFGFISQSGSQAVLRSRLPSAFADLTLAAGPSSSDYNLNTFGQVFDALNANATAYFGVRVTQGASTSSAVISSYVQWALNNSNTGNNVDSIKQAAAISNYLLNAVNCSLAQSCAALNRQACYRTPQTCGTCISSLYVGDDGDSNDACVLLTASPPSIDASVANKSCPSACSGHGTCSFASTLTGQPVGMCKIGDLTCKAVCQCWEDYSGSGTCSMTRSEIAAKQAMREQVIEGLQRLTVLENPDSESLQALIGNINAVSQQPDELTVSSSQSILNLTSYILTHLAGTDLSSDVAGGLLGSVQTTLTAKVNGQGSRRRLSSTDTLVSQSRHVLDQYAQLVVNQLVPGQEAVENVQSSFRVHVSMYEAGNGNVTVQLPRSSTEKSLGLQGGSITAPNSGNSSGSISIAAITMAAELYGDDIGGKPVQGNPLTLTLSSFPCQEAACYVQLVMSRQQYYNASMDVIEEAEVFNVSCIAGSHEQHRHICRSDGLVHTVTCSGKEEKPQGRCPVRSHKPSCSALFGTTDVDYGCILVDYTADNVTCSCPLLNMLTSHPSALNRHLFTAAAANNATIPAGTVSISYVSLLSTVTSSFTTTILTADNLSGSTIAKGYQALVTMGLFAAIVASALWYSHQADEQANKVLTEKTTKKQAAHAVNGNGRRSTFLRALTDKVINTDMKKKPKKPHKKKEKRGFLAMAEDALPSVLSSRSYTALIKQELKQHHRWLGVVFHYSDKFPRVLRVASLATNIIVMLFIQSMTYSLTNGDDGSCERNSTELTCLVAKSAFATGESKCYWTPMDTVDVPASDLGCHYVQPNNSIKVVLFVAIFSALVSTPIALLADYVISKVLNAQTMDNASRDQRVLAAVSGSGSPRKQLTSIAPAPPSSPVCGELVVAANGLDGHSRHVHTQEKFNALAAALRAYFLQLQREEDKAEFKSLWGLNNEGRLESTQAKSMFSMARFEQWLGITAQKKEEGTEGIVFSELLAVQRSYNQEVTAFRSKLLQMTTKEKTKRLLYLFQRDLLPGISGQILESKDTRDNGQVKGVSRTAKRIGWSFLFLLDVGMLFYIFLFAMTQSTDRQSAWAQSFAVWLAAEIFVISTCMVLLMNVLLPSLIMKDVKQIKQKLVDSLVRYHQQISKESGESKQDQEGAFNAAEYLFVSHRLAKTFSDLKTAQIIAQYHTVWPRQSYQHVVDVSQSYNRRFTALTRSASIVVLFFVSNLLTVPMSIQDMVMQMVSTAVTGYTFLIHIQLFQIFPVLVIIPTLLLAVIAHFLLQSHRKHQADSLQALLAAKAKYAPEKSKDKSKAEPRIDVDLASLQNGKPGSAAEDDDSESVSDSDSDSDDSEREHRLLAIVTRTKHNDEKDDDDSRSYDSDEKDQSASSNSDSEDDVAPLHEPLRVATISSGSLSSSSSSSSSRSSAEEVLANESCSDSVASDSDSVSSDSRDEIHDMSEPRKVPVAIPRGHTTRRQSLQQGLDVLQLARQLREK